MSSGERVVTARLSSIASLYGSTQGIVCGMGSETGPELPYPGLRPFEPDEAHIFFGRKRLVTELLERLKSHRFLAVVGPSGCGKSSLIRAGLIPALQAGFMARSRCEWNFAVFRPGNQPLLQLATALCKIRLFSDPNSDEMPDPGQLREDLDAGSRSLADRLIVNEWAKDANLLIVVDQFEEIFRFEREGGGDESRALVNLLLEAAEDPHIRAYVVITMRTDFIGHCPVFAGLPEALNQSQYLTPRLTREQTETAIVGPARLFGGEIDPVVVTHILNEMGTDPDQLPLMQHLLMRMWRRATFRGADEMDSRSDAPQVSVPDLTEGIQLTMADYRATGGLLNALGNHAESVFAKRLQTDRQRELAERMFRQLTAVAPDGQLIRRSPAPGFAELCEQLGVTNPDELRSIVDQFRIEGRSFLMPPPNEALTADSPIDISHESLIRKWARLQEWTRDEAIVAEVRREITKDAEVYLKGGRNPNDTSIPESRLLAALAWSKDHPLDVSPNVKEFLQACVRRREEFQRKDEQLRKSQRMQIAVLIIALVFLCLAGMAGRYWRQSVLQKEKTDRYALQRDSREAAQKFFAAIHEAYVRADLPIGLVWLVHAFANEPDRDHATKELYQIRFGAAFAQHPKLQASWRYEGLRALTVSSDGNRILIGHSSSATDQSGAGANQLVLRDIKKQKALPAIHCEFAIRTVHFSSNDDYFMAIGDVDRGDRTDRVLAVWHWPSRDQQPQRISNRSLETMSGLVTASFVPQVNTSDPPAIVSIVHSKHSPNYIQIWASPHAAPVELGVGASSIPSRPAMLHERPAEKKLAPSTALLVSSNGRYLATWGAGDRDHRDALRVFDLEDEIHQDLSIPAAIRCAAFSSDQRMLVTLDELGQATLYSTLSGEPLDAWEAHVGGGSCVAFSPDDSQLMTAGSDDVARMWSISVPKGSDRPATNISKARLLYELRHESSIQMTRFSPDGRLVATSTRDRMVRLWESMSGHAVVPPLYHATAVSNFFFHPDRPQIVTQFYDTVQVWDFASDNPLPRVLRAGSLLSAAAHSENGQYFAAVGRTDEGLEVASWNTMTGTPLVHRTLALDGASPLYAWISEDGKRVLTVTDIQAYESQQIVHIWNAEESEPRVLRNNSVASIRCAAFSPDGRLVITASAPSTTNENKWRVSVWHAETGEPLFETDQHGPVNHIVWNRQASHVVTSCGASAQVDERQGGGQLWRWDEQRSQLVKQFFWQHRPRQQTATGNAVLFAAFSADGNLVATGGADDAAYLWKISSPEPLSQRLEHASDIVHVAFSHDGRLLATSSIADKRACVWSVPAVRAGSNRATHTFQHESRVNRSIFSASDRLLATASSNGVARVWSLANGQLAAILQHEANVRATCFHPDGRKLFTVSYPGTDSGLKKKFATITDHLETNVGRRFVQRGNVADRWPRARQWHLYPTAHVPLDDVARLRDWVRLLAASEINEDKSAIRTLTYHDSNSTSPYFVAKEVERLWNAYDRELFREPVAMSHDQLAAASEATEQWFAAAWHLNRELQSERLVHQDAARQRLLVRLAYALEKQEKFEEALTRYNEAMSLGQERQPDLLIAIARVHSQLELWNDAIDYLTLALGDADDPTLWQMRARAFGKAGRWQEAIHDWTEAISRSPEQKHAELLAERGEAYANLQDWPAAVEDLSAVYAKTFDWKIGHRLAVAQYLKKDTDAYRATVDDMLCSLTPDYEPRKANTSVRVSVLFPDAQADYGHAVAVARRVVADSRSSPARGMFLNSLGAALYRAGQWEEAYDCLQQARQAHIQFRSRDEVTRSHHLEISQAKSSSLPQDSSLNDTDGTVWDWIFLAMTCQKLGRVDEARKWLSLAETGFEREASVSWLFRVELQLLLDEAALVAGPTKAPTISD